MWWSFEAAELTRNPGVEESGYVPVGKDEKGEYETPEDYVIWTRGDPYLGYPGDEYYDVTRPTEALTPESLKKP